MTPIKNRPTEKITQSFRTIRFGGRKDIYLHADDVLSLLAKARRVQLAHNGDPDVISNFSNLEALVRDAADSAREIIDA